MRPQTTVPHAAALALPSMLFPPYLQLSVHDSGSPRAPGHARAARAASSARGGALLARCRCRGRRPRGRRHLERSSEVIGETSQATRTTPWKKEPVYPATKCLAIQIPTPICSRSDGWNFCLKMEIRVERWCMQFAPDPISSLACQHGRNFKQIEEIVSS